MSSRYLIRNEYFHIPDVECDMAIRCVVYLSMPEFETCKVVSEIENAILQGNYAFAEYACCFWAVHLEIATTKMSDLGSNRLEELVECLGAFMDLQWENTGKTYTISDTLSESLSVLHDRINYDKVCQAVAAAKSWLRPTAKAPTGDEILRLPRAIAQVRAALEGMMISPAMTTERRDHIVQYHGQNHFKCARFGCLFFHQGFANLEDREQHVSRHERTFTCAERGCPYSFIGFASMKDLKKHTFDFHGTKTDTVIPEFPADVPIQPTQQKERRPLQVKNEFRCEHCNKLFTRGYNLRSHLRSHADERPFECSTCGSRFARQHDRNRHEASHSGEKKFICGGKLDSSPNSHWGCGRGFARSDALRLHFRSETGARCIKPLRDKAAAEWRTANEGALASEPDTISAVVDELLRQQPNLNDVGVSQGTDLEDQPHLVGGVWDGGTDLNKEPEVDESSRPRYTRVSEILN